MQCCRQSTLLTYARLKKHSHVTVSLDLAAPINERKLLAETQSFKFSLVVDKNFKTFHWRKIHGSCSSLAFHTFDLPVYPTQAEYLH